MSERVTIDAADLARLREDSKLGHVSSPATVLALIDALEKARGELGRLRSSKRTVAASSYYFLFLWNFWE